MTKTHSGVALATAALLMAAVAGGLAVQSRTIGRYADLPAGAYAVVADIRAKVGKEQALREATLPLVAAVRAEPNNLLYFLHEDLDAPGHFVFYEIFAGRTDFEAHNATAHVQAWFATLSQLADGEVKVVRMQVLGNAAAPR